MMKKKMVITKSCSFCPIEGHCLPETFVFKGEILIHIGTEKVGRGDKYVVKREKSFINDGTFLYCGRFWEKK